VEEDTNLDEEEEMFDLLVSNPPYVLRKDLQRAAPEILLYEDLRALDGGPDGLDVILPILNLADKVVFVFGPLVNLLVRYRTVPWYHICLFLAPWMIS
jgi:methylase of polypeptide subunit release factors